MFPQYFLKIIYDSVSFLLIKLSIFLFLQGLMGPPGREGLAGPRGEPVSHFQSLSGLSGFSRRQAQHVVMLTVRY